MTFSLTPKTLISLSVLLLAIAGVLCVLNTGKTKELRSNVAEAAAARDGAEHRRAAQEKEFKSREAAVAAEKTKIAESEARIASAESELIKLQTEKADLQAKLQAN